MSCRHQQNLFSIFTPLIERAKWPNGPVNTQISIHLRLILWQQ